MILLPLLKFLSNSAPLSHTHMTLNQIIMVFCVKVENSEILISKASGEREQIPLLHPPPCSGLWPHNQVLVYSVDFFRQQPSNTECNLILLHGERAQSEGLAPQHF